MTDTLKAAALVALIITVTTFAIAGVAAAALVKAVIAWGLEATEGDPR